MDEEKIVYRIDELPNPDDKKKIIECLKLDHRYVGDKEKEDYGPLFSEFIKTDGMFYQFNMFVKGKTYGKYHEGDLVVALRGNGNCITIYHNNHVVWELSLKTARNGKTTYVVSFNYDHARYYYGDNENCLAPLRRLLADNWFKRASREKGEKFKIEMEDNIPRNASIGLLRWERCKEDGPFPEDKVKESYNIIMGIMDTYFDIRYQKDQFRKKAGIVNEAKEAVTNRPSCIETRWRQRLFNNFKSISGEKETDLFAYDLEFSQKFPDSSIRSKIGVNEPDLLAIRFENGKPQKLFFVEVKSTFSACTSNTSGAEAHMKGMKRYTDEERFISKRVDDAWEILKQYKKIGVYKVLDELDFDELRKSCDLSKNVERVLLFTNNALPPKETQKGEEEKKSALDYYEHEVYKARVNEKAKKEMYNCRIWITTNNYFDDREIEIEEVYKPE